jgi:hypothetical protein
MDNEALLAHRGISTPSRGELRDGLTKTLSSELQERSLGLTPQAACLPDLPSFQLLHCVIYGTSSVLQYPRQGGMIPEPRTQPRTQPRSDYGCASAAWPLGWRS